MLAAALALLVAQPPAAPKLYPPEAATSARIAALRAELDERLGKLPADLKPDVRADVAIYAKAAEWTVRHGEWNLKDSAAQTVRVLEAGIGRAKAAADGKTPWREVTGRPVIRGFVSWVDGSVQPVAVSTPAGDLSESDWQCDVVLHGRDNTLTEVKFIAQCEAAKPSATKRIVIEPYGRGNNGYRWAGETDVYEAMRVIEPDPKRTVLRGFSMGGAGTWHIGLHHPTRFAAIQPGAGFTTTRGYTKLPADLPSYVEKCLTIYDAERYAENLFNLPAVAYSGANDKQKAAADGIERAVKGFPEKLRFTHLVAPGLEHKQPAEWVAKCDAELAKHLPRKDADRVRLVTYTPKYVHGGPNGPIHLTALERQYERAVLDWARTPDGYVVTTSNVRQVNVLDGRRVVLDGQVMDLTAGGGLAGHHFRREGGRWAADQEMNDSGKLDRMRFERRAGQLVPVVGSPIKRIGSQGPIDDAFTGNFVAVPARATGWHAAPDKLAADIQAQFAADWDRFMRGTLPTKGRDWPRSEVLFGDPASNPAITTVLPWLPIRWTEDELVVNGVRYDPATHLPVLIYPHPLRPGTSVVLNSGHTFGAKDFQGSNAQLYPRLGDWAVRKATGEVVASGLFDENWQFPKQ